MAKDYSDLKMHDDWVKFLKFTVGFKELPSDGTWEFENMHKPSNPSPHLQAVVIPNEKNFNTWIEHGE